MALLGVGVGQKLGGGVWLEELDYWGHAWEGGVLSLAPPSGLSAFSLLR